jgi:Fe-Mn family superoxide dismutase
MTNKQCELSFDRDALEPHMSRETLLFHYDKHHKGYADKLEALNKGTEYESLDLESIIEVARRNGDIEILNNAAQTWNHNFFWRSLSPNGGKPDGAIRDLVEKQFNSLDEFKNAFREAATSVFGSGWVWLVIENGGLCIVTSANAETPLGTEQTPLLTLDVWEHAYYVDYRNRRAAFADAFLDNLVNWNFAAANLDTLRSQRAA